MKLQFIKKLKLESAVGYLRIERKNQRKDIQEYLIAYDQKGCLYEGQKVLEHRIREYLTQLNLLRNYKLTDKGRETIETSYVAQPEEGKYKIWYCLDRLDADNRYTIVHLDRIAPMAEDRQGRIDESLDSFGETHFLLPAGEQTTVEPIRLLETKLYLEQYRSTADIEWQWEWNGLESSTITYTGDFQKGKDRRESIHKHTIPVPLSSQELGSRLQQYSPQWDNRQKRLRCAFDSCSGDEKETFIRKLIVLPDPNFDKINWTNIPLMPDNQASAVQWRNYRIEKALAAAYATSESFKEIVQSANLQEGLNAYKMDFNTPDIADHLPQITPIKPAFWHLAAPFDLTPTV